MLGVRCIALGWKGKAYLVFGLNDLNGRRRAYVVLLLFVRGPSVVGT